MAIYTNEQKRKIVNKFNDLKKAGYSGRVLKKVLKHNPSTVEKYAAELKMKIFIS